MTGEQWPADWQARKAGANCPTCEAFDTGTTPADMLEVATLDSTVVWLPRLAKVSGYAVVTWRSGHVAELTDLSPAHACDFMFDVRKTAAAIRDLFDPLIVNLLILGNNTPHLHAHVVPRYTDDAAPGGPLAWNQIVSPDSPMQTDAALNQQRLQLARALMIKSS